MRIGIDDATTAAEARDRAELSVLLGIPEEKLIVTHLPSVITFADRRASRAEARGDLFFPQTSPSI
jgi:transcriptional regulator of nitric oxide reductase